MEVIQDENKPVEDNSINAKEVDVQMEQRPKDPEPIQSQPAFSHNTISGGTQCATEKKKCHCGHTVLVVLNALLLVGLVVLYILFFKSQGSSLKNPNATAPIQASAGGLKIAYVNTDTLIAKYQYAIDIQKEMEDFSNQQKANYTQQITKFQNDYQTFLKEGPDMTYSQQTAKQKELETRGAKIQNLEAEIAMKIQEKTLSESEKMTRAVYAYIREYNESNQQFDLILARSFSSSPILYGNEGMDITNEIVEGLNKDYNEGKKIQRGEEKESAKEAKKSK